MRKPTPIFFPNLREMANVKSACDCGPPAEVQTYLVSTRRQSLRDFVDAEGSDFFSCNGDAFGHWRDANGGRTEFVIGDQIAIPGRAAARRAYLERLRAKLTLGKRP